MSDANEENQSRCRTAAMTQKIVPVLLCAFVHSCVAQLLVNVMDCCGILTTQEDNLKDFHTATTCCSSLSSMSAAVNGPRAMDDDPSITPSSSLSDFSSNNGKANDQVKAGDVSPHTIVQPRRLSAAIVTTEDSSHEYAKGREKVVIPPIENSLTETDHPAPLPHRKMPSSRPSSIRRYCSAPIENAARQVLTIPPPLRLEAWAEPPSDSFKVRGPYYLRNNKKEPSDGSVFQLLTVDIVQIKKPAMGGICSLPNERIQLALKREQETGIRELPEFVLCVNLIMPGDPMYHLVSYFGLDDIETIKTNKTPFGRVARRFFFGSSDKFRDETFKLIPRIVDGNFVVKKAVGSKPALLGTKVAQSYIRTERFCEIIVDISSDTVAEKIVKLTLGYVSDSSCELVVVITLCTIISLFSHYLTGQVIDCGHGICVGRKE